MTSGRPANVAYDLVVPRRGPVSAGGVITSTVLAPVSPRSWLATAFVLLDLVVGAVAFALIVALLALGFGLLPVGLLGLPVLLLVLVAGRAVAALERLRLRSLLGVELPARPRPGTAGTGWRRLWAWVISVGEWKQVAYALLLLPMGAVGATLVLAGWCAGLVFGLLPLYAGALPEDGHRLFGGSNGDGLLRLLAVAGLVLLFVAPWVARGWAALDVAVARALLGPNDRELLAARVASLTQTRAAVVDAADAERRRIERDLHDGAQQRLVALAMNLGRAKAKLDDDPQGARVLVEQAHADAKEALAELRDLVRGIHPAVLTDRGLDAALSALAVRCPVPVSLRVDTDADADADTDADRGRCAPAAEAVAYFVVAEALSNVAKHAGASRAEVQVWRQGPLLRLVVSDDGAGGARVAEGSGLAGLRDRVAAVDGVLAVTSPPGGGTQLSMELPCAS